MASTHPVSPASVEKTPSGIAGFDQITGGGLPAGRSTLVCGGPGSGKTIFAVEFLVRGAQLGEPGVFITFEESVNDLSRNVASLGFDLVRLQEQKLLAVDYVHLDPAEIEEAGGYSLDGLFVRLAHAIDEIGAKRVAIDTLEVLFSTLKDDSVVRAETHRLFRFLKSRASPQSSPRKPGLACSLGKAWKSTFRIAWSRSGRACSINQPRASCAS